MQVSVLLAPASPNESPVQLPFAFMSVESARECLTWAGHKNCQVTKASITCGWIHHNADCMKE